jgi:hypothetical protein
MFGSIGTAPMRRLHVSMSARLIHLKVVKTLEVEMHWNPRHLGRWLREPHIKP